MIIFITGVVIIVLISISWPMITGKDWAGEEIDTESYYFIIAIWFMCFAYGLFTPYFIKYEHDGGVKYKVSIESNYETNRSGYHYPDRSYNDRESNKERTGTTKKVPRSFR